MKRRNRSRTLIGTCILCSLLLLAVGIFIGIRPSTTLSRSSNQSTLSRADAATKSGAWPFEGRKQESRSEPRNNTGTGFTAPRESAAQFSGFTTSDRPIASATPAATPKEEVKEPLPLALRSVDSETLKITPEQQQIINELRQAFIDKIAAAKLEPGDPRYAALWEQLQPEIDQQFRAQLGQEFFLQYERSTMGEK